MARSKRTNAPPKTVTSLTHKETSRTNIPTSELESLMRDEDRTPIQRAYARRNRDLDPQLVWRGKDEQDESDLHVQAPPLYIQEKVHPKALIEDLRRESEDRAKQDVPQIPDLFADFNGLPNLEAKTEFYQHEQNWSNRMILGDALQAMASLAEREGLRGKVQCIYMDPPYGIKFNSNFQWSTRSRDVKDGDRSHITREPEQVKAFRDTWRDGIHSYLTYLRDRLTLARELLTDSGSIFVQIGDENVHRVRAVMDEVFGEENFLQSIIVKKKSISVITEPVNDFVLWACKNRNNLKIRSLVEPKDPASEKSRFKKIEKIDLTRIAVSEATSDELLNPENRLLNDDYPMVSQDPQKGRNQSYVIQGMEKLPGRSRHWTLDPIDGMRRIERANRLRPTTNTLRGVVFLGDYGQQPLNNIWNFHGESNPVYVVQTNRGIVQRCILMSTKPGDLVLDPTCGSGTTAYVAEHWGRRWITIDTSRVALALARARIMGARYPYYLLADSREGQLKEAEVADRALSEASTFGHVSQGFVYRRVPHITLKSIADNAEIDVIYDAHRPMLESALGDLNRVLARHQTPYAVDTGGRKGGSVRFDAIDERVTLPSGEVVLAGKLLEWEVPREPPADWPEVAHESLERFWKARIDRQQKIDGCIAVGADSEPLYDKPYEDNKKVRVAGPFTVESLTPHRTIEAASSAPESSAPRLEDERGAYSSAGPPATPSSDFTAVILEQLRAAGVQQADKRSKIEFTALSGWPGDLICAEGRYQEGDRARRAGILVGSEHGTLGKQDLMGAAREAAESGFDVLITCAFNYDAQTTEVGKLGKLPILKARMNADLHMSTDLKQSKNANLFVIFGEPDIELLDAPNNQIRVKIKGIDIFDPGTGEVRSSEPNELACWFIDTDYDMASFFVRHAYFLGAGDPYKNLKNTLKAEIDEEAWLSLRSDTSRPFHRPTTGRIAVKAINHLGDEVMRVIRVA